MTPNPQNIGAAPEEYPIRALVKANNDIGLPKDMEGRVSNWRRSGWDMYDSENKGYLALDEHLIIDPTPEQIAEERAKAGLPPQEGEALPEAKPKGPSIIFGHPNEKPYQYHFNPDPDAIVQAPEVPQPGEGVEADVKTIRETLGLLEWGYDDALQALDRLARAALGKAGA